MNTNQQMADYYQVQADGDMLQNEFFKKIGIDANKANKNILDPLLDKILKIS